MKSNKMGYLFLMPTTHCGPQNTPLNPEQWALTIARKAAQDAAEAAVRAAKSRLIPSLEMI